MARTEPDSPASSRTPLPDGTIPVAIGLLIAGVASYLFLKIAKSAMGGTDEAIQPLTSLWFATFALAPGFFLPVEQEVARALSHRRATGHGGRPVVSRVITLVFILAAVVIVAAIVMWWTGWYYADPLVSAGIGLFILPRTWRLMGDAVGVLLEGTPADVNLAELRRALLGLDDVQDVHDLHVWTLTSGVNALSVHLVADPQSSVGGILTRARRCVTHEFKITHVTIQVEPPGWHCDGPHL